MARHAAARSLLLRSFLLLAAALLPACGRDEGGPGKPAGTGPLSGSAEAAPGVPVPPARETPATASPPAGLATRTSSSAEGETVPEGATNRWYELLQDGQKLGWLHVVWEPITHDGKPAVRDTTTQVTRSGRDMIGTVDVFEDRTVMVTERGLDGTYWRQRATSTAPTSSGGRVTTSSTTWTGSGYDVEIAVSGETPEKRSIPAAEPTAVDVEAYLSRRAQSGELKVGDRFSVPLLHERKRRVVHHPVEVVGREEAEGEAGPVPCWKVSETEPDSKTVTWLWIDGDGALVRLKVEATEIRRRTPADARKSPAEIPTFPITVKQNPQIERLFAADEALVDVRVAADEDRSMPVFPASPWSTVTGSKPDGAGGMVFHVRMKAYDSREKSATIPVTDPAFAPDLEATHLMECQDPRVVRKAKSIVGDAKDAREAAARIAKFVFGLRKQSPEVSEATAVEILDQMQGDCSEHALLFVALCRAAGLPARRCSGFVCVGSDWGAHAWAEIWTGQWIGVDPTTGDIGTAARYLFFGYSDDPETLVGAVSSRARGRLSFTVREVVEGGDTVTLDARSRFGLVDEKEKTASLPLSGLYAAQWPEGWTVRTLVNGTLRISGPGVRASAAAHADQGYRDLSRLKEMGGEEAGVGTFAGRTAVLTEDGADRRALVPWRRMIFIVDATLTGSDPAADWATVAKILAPTFAERSKVAR